MHLYCINTNLISVYTKRRLDNDLDVSRVLLKYYLRLVRALNNTGENQFAVRFFRFVYDWSLFSLQRRVKYVCKYFVFFFNARLQYCPPHRRLFGKEETRLPNYGWQLCKGYECREGVTLAHPPPPICIIYKN